MNGRHRSGMDVLAQWKDSAAIIARGAVNGLRGRSRAALLAVVAADRRTSSPFIRQPAPGQERTECGKGEPPMRSGTLPVTENGCMARPAVLLGVGSFWHALGRRSELLARYKSPYPSILRSQTNLPKILSNQRAHYIAFRMNLTRRHQSGLPDDRTISHPESARPA
jgi:hypothetical protein